MFSERTSSERKNSRKIRYSTAIVTTHGNAINAVKCKNVKPVAAKAMRLVRFDTGRSVDAEFDRCALAYEWGRGLAPMDRAAAITAGVRSTTVASRLRTAVVRAAAPNT